MTRRKRNDAERTHCRLPACASQNSIPSGVRRPGRTAYGWDRRVLATGSGGWQLPRLGDVDRVTGEILRRRATDVRYERAGSVDKLPVMSRRPASGAHRISRRVTAQLPASRRGSKATRATMRVAPLGNGSEERAERSTRERTRSVCCAAIATAVGPPADTPTTARIRFSPRWEHSVAVVAAKSAGPGPATSEVRPYPGRDGVKTV